MKYDFTTIPERYESNSMKWVELIDTCEDLPEDAVPFGTADMDLMMAPEIVTGLQEYIGKTVLGYTRPSQGYYDALLGWLENRYGWKAKKEWIINTPGVVAALCAAVESLTEPGDGVIIMTPVYHPFYASIKNNGRTIVDSPMIPTADCSYEIDFADFEAKAKDPKNTLLIFCSPANPTGRVWRRDELEKVAKICLENNVTIVSDEIHCDLCLPGYQHIPMASLSEEIANITITCTAASKTFNVAGLKTSAIFISNDEMREKVNTAMGAHRSSGSNMLGIKAAEIAYSQCGQWLDECRELIKQNYEYIRDYCAEHIPEIKVTKLEGTFLPWIDMRAFGMDEEELLADLKANAKIYVGGGKKFGEAGNGFVRFTIGVPHKAIVGTMERLGKWAESKRQ